MYTIISIGLDGRVHHYGIWTNYEAARRWGIGFHGHEPTGKPANGAWKIVEVNRVA
jgi:hypothetical protein